MDGPLHALFLRAWTTPGFADEVAAAPHALLAAAGLAVGDDVEVIAFGWREETEHLCWTCQLAVPGLYATLGPGRAARASALDALFTDARVPADGRAHLAALGIPVMRNVRVVLREGPRAHLELQLCEAHHACLCEAPELEPIVFAAWRE
jgi:hypothetical protein